MIKFERLEKIKTIVTKIEDSGTDLKGCTEICEIYHNLKLLEQLIQINTTYDVENIDELIESKSIAVDKLL